MNISTPETILSQARESEKVQRLSRKGVDASASKRHLPRPGKDIVSSLRRRRAAVKSGNGLANHFEDKCSDFGSVSIVPNRFSRERDAYVIDPDLIEMATLRPIQSEELAKTGDATKFMVLAEVGLQVNQEAGLGIAADLTES